MISPLDVSVLDRNSEELGLPTTNLMEEAGRSLAEEVHDRYGGGPVLIFVGPGNNGGDGLVAARYLAKMGSSVTVVLMKEHSRSGTDLSRKAFRDLPSNVDVIVWDDSMDPDRIIEDHEVVIDGLLGSGAAGTPRGVFGKVVRSINSSDKKVVSIDIPTGIGSGLSINANVTVTFHDVKSNMMSDGTPRKECGEIVIRKIGILEDAWKFVGRGDLLRIPGKGPEAHKGSGGKLLIIGGGPYTGAPTLSALAAVKTGCDLIRVAVPYGIWQVVASASPDLIVERMMTKDPFTLGHEVKVRIFDLLEWADAVLIGPGAGRSEGTLGLLKDVVIRCIERGKRTVVDADGIKSVCMDLSEWPRIDSDRFVITPHRGELRMLLDGAGLDFNEALLENPYSGKGNDKWSEKALEPLIEFTRATGADLLVKGRLDLMMTPHFHSLSDHIRFGGAYMRYNRTGVREMSVGGTGDILSGLCSGFLARKTSGFDASCIAAYVNGKAGELTRSHLGISLSASSMLERLPQVLNDA